MWVGSLGKAAIWGKGEGQYEHGGRPDNGPSALGGGKKRLNTPTGKTKQHRVEKTRSLWEGLSRARANGRSLARRSLCAPSLLLDGGEVGMCGAVWGAVSWTIQG